MKIPDKLPNPQKYRDFPELTKEEWEDYYACREKYDIEMTEDEKWEIRDKACDLFEKGFEKEARELLFKIPVDPFFAMSSKIAGGFDTVKYFNLYEAKKVYPDEF